VGRRRDTLIVESSRFQTPNASPPCPSWHHFNGAGGSGSEEVPIGPPGQAGHGKGREMATSAQGRMQIEAGSSGAMAMMASSWGEWVTQAAARRKMSC